MLSTYYVLCKHLYDKYIFVIKIAKQKFYSHSSEVEFKETLCEKFCLFFHLIGIHFEEEEYFFSLKWISVKDSDTQE